MERRQAIRQRIEEPKKYSMIFFSLEKRNNFDVTANAVDRGPGGLGISVDYALEPGFVVMLDDEGKLKQGIIAWIRRESGGAVSRAGIKFVPNFEELQNYSLKNDGRGFTLPEFQHPGLVASILVDVVEREEERYVQRRGY